MDNIKNTDQQNGQQATSLSSVPEYDPNMDLNRSPKPMGNVLNEKKRRK